MKNKLKESKKMNLSKLCKFVYDYPPKSGVFKKGDKVEYNGKIIEIYSRMWNKKTSLEGYIILYKYKYYVVFKGSVEIKDWILDFLFFPKKFKGVKVHRGVLKQYMSIRDKLRGELFGIEPVFFIGHSLGGGVAILSKFDIGIKNVILSTYGALKVFKKYKMLHNTFNFITKGDLVPKLPFSFAKNCNQIEVGKKQNGLKDCHDINNYIDSVSCYEE